MDELYRQYSQIVFHFLYQHWHKSSRIALEEVDDTLESERNTEQELIAKIELMDVWDKLQMYLEDMRKVLEGFRKIKEKMKYLRIANMLLLTSLVSFSVRTFLRRTNYHLILSFTILFAVCMCINLIININRQTPQRPEKADCIICVLSL